MQKRLFSKTHMDHLTPHNNILARPLFSDGPKVSDALALTCMNLLLFFCQLLHFSITSQNDTWGTHQRWESNLRFSIR